MIDTFFASIFAGMRCTTVLAPDRGQQWPAEALFFSS
jgi:hypothetical protein